MSNMSKKNKIILALSIMAVVVIIITSGTFAYFGWFAEEESLVSVTVSSGTGSCLLASDNEVFIEPSSTRNDGRIIKLSAKQEMAYQAYITWNLVVNEINGLQDESFLYELVNSSTGQSYGSGNFADIVAGDTITFSNGNEILDYNTEYEFTLYLWIDGENFTNPLEMADQEFDFDMSCSIATSNVPVKFGEFYYIYIEGSKLQIVFYDDGSAVGLQDGNMEQMPAGSFSYQSNKIIDTETGDVWGTVSADGREIDLGNVILRLGESSPIYFGEVYTASDDGVEIQFVFYNDGSVVLFNNGSVVESAAAGTFVYQSNKIIVTETGDVFGTVSADGREINSEGIIFTLTEPSPIYFSEVYTVSNDGVELQFVFYNDGSVVVFDDGSVGESVAAGSFAYRSNQIIDTASGEVIITISADGKEITFDGVTFSLEESPIHFGEAYSAYVDGEKFSMVFYNDGSVLFYQNDVIGASLPIGTYAYRSNDIIDTSTGEVFATISDDGREITSDGVKFTL